MAVMALQLSSLGTVNDLSNVFLSGTSIYQLLSSRHVKVQSHNCIRERRASSQHHGRCSATARNASNIPYNYERDTGVHSGRRISPGHRPLCDQLVPYLSHNLSLGETPASGPARRNYSRCRAGRGLSKTSNQSSETQTPAKPLGGGEVLITGEALAKTYTGMQYLFEGLDISVSKGQKIGFLGANGCGKSTLLKVLAGVEAPDKGTVQRRRGVRLGYLAQDPEIDDSLTVLDAVFAADTPVMSAVREYERAVAKQAAAVPGSPEERACNAALQAAMDNMDALQAWDVASEAEKLLEILGVGFTDRQVATLSGGQRKRVAMAATLLAKPELVILDEPTNHMDVRVIEWMEKMLSDPALTVLLVTHDRYFLDTVCNQMLELDGGGAYRHTGNYSTYLANRAQRLADTEAAIARAETVLRKEAEWMSRQPKARSTKSRERIDRFHALTKKAERGPPPVELALAVGEARLGRKVLAMDDATAVRGDRTIFDGFKYEFGRGDRIGIVGRNGVGKSTFLDAIAGLLPLESGTRDAGDTLVMGYYTQQTPPVPDDMRVIEYARQFGESVMVGSEHSGGFQGASAGVVESVTAVNLLERFGFSRSKQYDRAGSLSGGEKRRLYLATILMQRPNFLLLDEPTNDLDLPTIQVLESFLSTFEGSLLVASHDRAFMDNVAARLFVLEGDGEIQLYDGTYSEYMEDGRQREEEQKQREKGAAVAAAASAAAGAKAAGKAGSAGGGAGVGAGAGKGGKEAAGGGGAAAAGKGGRASSQRVLSYMERKEYQGLEREIDKLNAKREVIEAEMQQPKATADYAVLATLAASLAQLTDLIDAKSERWLELAEIAGE